MKQMKPLKSQPKKYICDTCNYETNNKKDFNKHTLTRKHKINIGEIKKIPKKYFCEICNTIL